VESDISRWKRVIGEGLRSQTDGRQASEVAIAADVLNQCWSWDARNTSASHNPKHGSGSVRPHPRSMQQGGTRSQIPKIP
jgi:hypothetical protein